MGGKPRQDSRLTKKVGFRPLSAFANMIIDLVSNKMQGRPEPGPGLSLYRFLPWPGGISATRGFSVLRRQHCVRDIGFLGKVQVKAPAPKSFSYTLQALKKGTNADPFLSSPVLR